MEWLWLIFVTALGACVGSFLNVVIYRMPRGESIVFPGSHCPSCGHAIQWYDNIPLVSWFALRGRCRRCKTFISSRYVIIEAATALRVAGLFACYYLFHVRTGRWDFPDTWPAFASHAALLCGLLACAVVDEEHFQIPLEVMWVCTVIGLVAAAGDPHAFRVASPEAVVSPTTIAIGLGAVVGLLVSLFLLRRGYLQPSFLDAEDKPPRLAASQSSPPVATPPAGSSSSPAEASALKKPAPAGKQQPAKSPAAEPAKGKPAAPPPRRAMGLRSILRILTGAVTASTLTYVPGVRSTEEEAQNVAMSAEHGVSPRKEILREALFLTPPFFFAAAVAVLLLKVPAAREAWSSLLSERDHPQLAPHLVALGSAIFGYLIGGLWVWATRILGTLAFNKEAMGLGDVHILAAIGAVTGWVVPSLTFFVAPFIGLVWVLYICIARRQRVVAYGPLLATGCLAVLLLYDPLLRHLRMLLTGER